MMLNRSSHRSRSRLCILAMAACCLLFAACEVHDYWGIPDVLKVDAENDRDDAEMLETDLFVRYQLDYSVKNTEPEPTEVVVQGSSFVNDIKRTTGKKVWHLDADEVGNGILTSPMLQYGNALQISLVCCNQSACSKNEVLCPETDDENNTAPTDNALFCYQACQDTTRCVQECPAHAACKEYCNNVDPQNLEDCMRASCSQPGAVQSCKQYCNADEQCIESCEIHETCEDYCSSSAAACFKNCISTWAQCADSVFENVTVTLPCSICNSELDKKTACSLDLTSTPEMDQDGNPILTLKNRRTNEVYTCSNEYNCDRYPPQCLTDCKNLYETDTTRMNCLDACLQQHLYWCNDYTVLSEYIDTRYDQPCCYDSTCHAELGGIVKTMNVECFDNSSCSSNHYCSDDGVCTENVASSCSVQMRSRTDNMTFAALLLLTVIPFLSFVRRRKISLRS